MKLCIFFTLVIQKIDYCKIYKIFTFLLLGDNVFQEILSCVEVKSSISNKRLILYRSHKKKYLT